MRRRTDDDRSAHELEVEERTDTLEGALEAARPIHEFCTRIFWFSAILGVAFVAGEKVWKGDLSREVVSGFAIAALLVATMANSMMDSLGAIVSLAACKLVWWLRLPDDLSHRNLSFLAISTTLHSLAVSSCILGFGFVFAELIKSGSLM